MRGGASKYEGVGPGGEGTVEEAAQGGGRGGSPGLGERGQPGAGGTLGTVAGAAHWPGPMGRLDSDRDLLMGDEEPQPTRKRL